MSRTRVLLVDDHALFREGLAGILQSQPDLNVIGEASDGIEAAVKARELVPDLILMDVQMPGMDGIEATRQIKSFLPEVIIVMLTIRDDDEHLFEAIKAGAQGYILKDVHSNEMLGMLYGVLRGEAALSPRLAARVLSEFRRLGENGIITQADDSDLTEREQQVLALISQGETDKEIAITLTLSVNTVKTHVRSILSKLYVSTRREAARVARKKGLV